MVNVSDLDYVENPPLEEVSSLLLENWARPCWKYDASLLASYMSFPSGDPSLSAGYYYQGELISYLSCLPMNLLYSDRSCRGVIGSLNTVSKKSRIPGINTAQFEKMVRKLQEKGYDLLVALCEEKNISNFALRSIFSHLKLPFVKVFSYNNCFLSTAVIGSKQFHGIATGKTCTFRSIQEHNILHLVNSIGRTARLRKIYNIDDINYWFSERPRVRTFLYEFESNWKAIASFSIIDMLDCCTEQKCAIMNVLCWDVLDDVQKKTFLYEVLFFLEHEGIRKVIFPDMKYHIIDPIKMFKYYRSNADWYVYVAVLNSNKGINPVSVESVFFDIY